MVSVKLNKTIMSPGLFPLQNSAIGVLLSIWFLEGFILEVKPPGIGLFYSLNTLFVGSPHLCPETVWMGLEFDRPFR